MSDRYGRGSSDPRPEGARAMPHVRQPGAGVPPRPRGPQYDAPYDDGYSDGQTYRSAGHRPGPPGPPPYPDYDEPPRRRRLRRWALGLVLALILVVVGTYFWADSKLKREVDLASVEDRPAAGEGTNYLIVGSDSREGLTEDQRDELHTGDAEGQRTDTIMILHTGEHGSTLVSLPRDSYVTIPPFTGSVTGNRIPEQQQKLNSAYSFEGPELLVRTVEYNTGLHIDHYAEIGFGGFANVVDALGGVEMCFDEPVKDRNSGADFEAGCHQLNGAEALAFNRQRYQEPEGDLGRTKNQQEFLGTIADQAASPATLLNPFRLYPTMGASLDSLIVDKDMSLWKLRSMFWAMRGATKMNIPVADPGYASEVGSAVLWDKEQTELLMEQLRNDEEVTVGTD